MLAGIGAALAASSTSADVVAIVARKHAATTSADGIEAGTGTGNGEPDQAGEPGEPGRNGQPAPAPQRSWAALVTLGARRQAATREPSCRPISGRPGRCATTTSCWPTGPARQAAEDERRDDERSEHEGPQVSGRGHDGQAPGAQCEDFGFEPVGTKRPGISHTTRVMLPSMVENVLTGVIVTYVVSLLGLAWWYAWLAPDRFKRKRFFGIDRRNRKASIRCSFLDIQPGGAHGTERLRVGFTGPAIIRSEYLGAQALRLSLLSTMRQNQRIAVDRLSVSDISIDASPRTLSEEHGYNNGTLVLLGSRVYNELSHKYFDEDNRSFFCWLRAANNERTFLPRGESDNNLPYRRTPLQGEDPASVRTHQLAVIERHRDGFHDRWVFVVAGVGALATTGATKFLAENWRLLDTLVARKKLDREFALLLDFENCTADLDFKTDLDAIPEPIVLRVRDRYKYVQPIGGELML